MIFEPAVGLHCPPGLSGAQAKRKPYPLPWGIRTARTPDLSALDSVKKFSLVRKTDQRVYPVTKTDVY